MKSYFLSYLTITILAANISAFPMGWLHNNRNSIGLGTALTACGLIAYKLWHTQQTKHKRRIIASIKPGQPKPWAIIEKRYRAWFKQTEETYMQEFFALCNITEQEWQTYVKKTKCNLIDNDKKLLDQHSDLFDIDPTMHTKIKELFKQHLPEKIIHIVYRECENHTMAVSLNILFINLTNCIVLTEKEFETALLHEIQHIIHRDSIHREARTNLCLDKSIPKEQREKLLGKVSRFEEMRADILGSLALTPEHAQCDSIHFYKCIKDDTKRLKILNDLGLEKSHPSNRDRYTYLNKLYREMWACV